MKTDDGKDIVPIFPPCDYDEKTKCWILEQFAHCGKQCSKAGIIESNLNNKPKRLGLLSRFLREYFEPDLEHVTYVPRCAIKTIHPGGWMTKEEYKQCSGRFDNIIGRPPFRFVDTSIELISVEQKEKNRIDHFDRLASAKATLEQQENFLKRVERVTKERKTKTSIQNTMIGKQLGIITKNQQK